jgi:hypothetical protein
MKTLRSLFIPLLSLLIFTACSKEEDDQNVMGTNNNLPSTIAGESVLMRFSAPQTGAPYTDNQEIKFTFSSNGLLSIDENPDDQDGDELSIASFTELDGEYIWADAANDLSYKLSLKDDNSINELNLFTTSSNTFLGQFLPLDGSSTNLVANYAGNYSVTSVDKGNHNRMTVSIDADGNIDFDTNVLLQASDFALVSDRLDCCDGIWVDMSPYPTEPYARINLFVDNTSRKLNKVEYLPEYPSIANRVTVNLEPSQSGGNSSNKLTVSGDFVKVGGDTYTPDKGLECTSCTSSEKYTWTQNESAAPNRVFSVEIINATGLVILDFSGSSAFAANANDLASLGVVHDPTAKTFTFTDVDMNEKFSQPGTIRLNGTLTYE